MRASILPTSSGRRAAAVSWICATCQREAIGVGSQSQSPASRAAAAAASAAAPLSPACSRAFSTGRTLYHSSLNSPPQPSQRQRRFLSSAPSSQPSSPPPRDDNETSASPLPLPKEGDAEESKNKIPQFYALFPDTLPLGPPPRGPFHIDVPTLRREFLRLQAAAHPDFHHSAQLGESAAQRSARSRAEATSALINTAFKTLSNPLTRAQYLLQELSGVDLAGDEAGGESGAPDPELLMTVMEAREVIDEAESEHDLEGVNRENEERIEESEKVLEEAFGHGDWEGAKREAVRLRYWVNIREGIRNWEGPGKGVVIHH